MLREVEILLKLINQSNYLVNSIEIKQVIGTYTSLLGVDPNKVHSLDNRKSN